MSDESGWVVKENSQAETHVMPAKRVPASFPTVLDADLYARDVRRAGSPIVQFSGQLWVHWGHVPSQDCECKPETRMENDRVVWVHTHPN